MRLNSFFMDLCTLRVFYHSALLSDRLLLENYWEGENAPL
jgi:hypothetical protein